MLGVGIVFLNTKKGDMYVKSIRVGGPAHSGGGAPKSSLPYAPAHFFYDLMMSCKMGRRRFVDPCAQSLSLPQLSCQLSLLLLAYLSPPLPVSVLSCVQFASSVSPGDRLYSIDGTLAEGKAPERLRTLIQVNVSCSFGW
jgi:hypothetical protein